MLNEDHRYIYKKDFTYSGIGEELGITRQTVSSAVKALIKYRLIREDIDNPKYYLIYIRNWVPIDLDVLTTFLGFTKKKKDNIDLLRVYLSLKKMIAISQCANDRQFTLTDMMEILGHNTTDDSIRDTIRHDIYWLHYLKLIEISAHQSYSPKRGKYIVYHLQKVFENTDHEEFDKTLSDDISATVLPQKIKEQLKFSIPLFQNEELEKELK